MKTVRTSGKRKVLGILGGMGPLATADLYRTIIELTPAGRDQDHVPVIVLGNPEIPNRTESISSGQHKALPYLIEGATFLEHSGADFIVIPCNTAHYYIEDLRQGIRIPILSIIEETVEELSRLQPVPGCIGILASNGTCAANLYGALIAQAGVRYIYPDHTHQELVANLIRDIKAGVPPVQAAGLLEQVSEHMVSHGAELLILGCTELPIVAPVCQLKVPVLNPTRILAAAAVAYSVGV